MKYTPVELIHVFLDLDGTLQKVGRLAHKERRIYFEYDTAFLQSKLDISPFKLPLKAGVIPSEDNVFGGLFGVFNDSLPDGWGKLLLDRQVRNHGIPAEHLTPLNRLTHVGMHGMGALRYQPNVSTPPTQQEISNLDYLATEVEHILQGDTAEVLTELLELSASSTGARPKIMVGVNPGATHIIHGADKIPKGFEHWMIKFTSGIDNKDSGAVEYAYSLMARAAGLNLMPTRLFPAKKGYGYFGVQRFDRSKNSRLHMHTACGLLHSDHRLPSLDYVDLLKVTQALTRNKQEVEKMFHLAVFNVLAHNRDDHGKNFSFLMQSNGIWHIAPAYDLTFSAGPNGEHSTTLLGEGRNPSIEHLTHLADHAGIRRKTTQHILQQVMTAINDWPAFARTAGVSRLSISHIAKVLFIK